MSDLSSVKPWVHLIGGITIVAALWAAQDVVFPVVLAALLTFVLSGPVSWLERRIGRVPAVLGAVGFGFAALAIALWVMTWQLDRLVNNLPRYRQTLVTKLADLRDSGRGGAVDELQKTIEDVKEGLAGTSGDDRRRRSTVVLAERIESGEAAFPWLGSVVGIVTQVGVIVTLVIFMLLERRDLRDRIIGLIGRGHVALTTKALDEAGSRVSRHLLMQSVVNGLYGVAAAVGLWYLGVPHAFVWAVLGAVLRFIPYLGPILGAGAPIVISIAAMDGWSVTLQVVALYVVLELFTNLVLETVLYAGAAGVSQVGLLLSVTFWTWLWGPAGLLVATPLTVVLVVMGKHVRGLEVIATLMADTTTLPPAQGCYQRLLARDTAEAADIVERHVRNEPPRSVYDDLLLPALAFVEADRLENRVTSDEARPGARRPAGTRGRGRRTGEEGRGRGLGQAAAPDGRRIRGAIRARARLGGQRAVRRTRPRHAGPPCRRPSRGDTDRVEAHGHRDHRRGARRRVGGRVPGGPAAAIAVADALPAQEAPRTGTAAPDHRRPVGAAGVCRHLHATADRGWSVACESVAGTHPHAARIDGRGGRMTSTPKARATRASAGRPRSRPHLWRAARRPRGGTWRFTPLQSRERKPAATLATKARRLLWAWWMWAAFTLALTAVGHWGWAIATGLLAFVSHLIRPQVDPPQLGLDHEFDTQSPEFLTTMAGATGVPFIPGNSFEILDNGDAFYPRMLDDVRSASTSIAMEAYIFWAGEIGMTFAEALAERARAGVRVMVLLDAVGSSSIGDEHPRRPRGRRLSCRLVQPPELEARRPVQQPHAPEVARDRRGCRVHGRRGHCRSLAGRCPQRARVA